MSLEQIEQLGFSGWVITNCNGFTSLRTVLGRIDRGDVPRAAFVQQLVEAWREMDRRRRLAKSA